MTQTASVRLLLPIIALGQLTATVAGCQTHAWSRYQHVPYQRWRADDGARTALLREVVQGCSLKAQRLRQGPGLYHLTMSRRWARKARIALEALRLLQASPPNPRPACAKALSRLRWQIDYRYPCAVGWVTSLFVHTYLKSSPDRRARLLQRIRRMGYHCGPHRDWEGIFLNRLRRARPCATGAHPVATAAPTPGPAGPLRTVTPPPAPGHTRRPPSAPPRKKSPATKEPFHGPSESLSPKF